MTCTSKCGPTCVLGSGGASGALRCATWRATGACDRRFGHLLETEMRGREFQLLGRLVASAPVLRLHPHKDGQLGRLCEMVERDLYQRANTTAQAVSCSA